MITSLRLVDFKNFVDESLRMGPFTVIAGANASGKSNIRDALRFLHGVGRGYTLAEILDRKYGPGDELQWDGIRGAPNEVARLGQDGFEVHVRAKAEGLPAFREAARCTRGPVSYRIRSKRSPERFHVVQESLKVEERYVSPKYHVLYDSHPADPDPVQRQEDETHLLLRMGKSGEQRKYGHRIATRPNQPALTQISEHKKVLRLHKERADAVANSFSNMRFLDPLPSRMRLPSSPGQTTLGDRGDHLATVLKDVCEDQERREALVEWVRELTPMDVTDFKFISDPLTSRIQLAFREANGRTVSAYSASDGTLRFLAILAALLSRTPAQFYFFEEIDNGIHPSRLRLLVDLIERQTAKGKTQVVTTTHSPELLAMISDRTFENTSVICRVPGAEEAVIRRVSDLPAAKKLRESQGLGRLHASGWLEDAVFFGDGEGPTVESGP